MSPSNFGVFLMLTDNDIVTLAAMFEFFKVGPWPLRLSAEKDSRRKGG